MLSLLLLCFVVLLVAGVLVWAVNSLSPSPLDPTLAQVIRVLVIAGAILYCVLALYRGRATL